MDERKEICRIGRILAQKGFISGTDGNISCKIGKDRIIITPTGLPKGELSAKDIVVIDISGRVIRGTKKPSGEMWTHLEVYRNRPDVKAVVHAHLPYVTALTVAGVRLSRPVLPETYVMMGNVPTAPYATPSSFEGATALKRFIKGSSAIILDRHGAIAFGDSLKAALIKLEKLEHTARVVTLARTVGRVKTLNASQVARLDKLKGKLYGSKR